MQEAIFNSSDNNSTDNNTTENNASTNNTSTNNNQSLPITGERFGELFLLETLIIGTSSVVLARK